MFFLRIGILKLALLCVLYSMPSSALELNNYRLLYQVVYAGNSVGKIEVLMQKKDNQYCTTATTKLGALARLFLSEQRTETCFNIQQQGLQVAGGRDFNLEETVPYRSFSIDYANSEIRFSRGEVLPISSQDQFESTSFPLVLVSCGAQSLAEKSLFDINAKRLRLYRYTAVTDGMIDWQGEDVAVSIIKRYGDNDSRRSTTYFLSQQGQVAKNIPLQIVDTKKGNDTVLRLLEFTNL